MKDNRGTQTLLGTRDAESGFGKKKLYLKYQVYTF